MNTPSKFALIFATAVAFFALNHAGSVEIAQPAQQQAVIHAEQYKVIDMSQVPVQGNGSAAGSLEAVLNDFGAQGWSVRTATGNAIILAR